MITLVQTLNLYLVHLCAKDFFVIMKRIHIFQLILKAGGTFGGRLSDYSIGTVVLQLCIVL